MKKTTLAQIASSSPEEIEKFNWKIVADTMVRLARELESARGARMSWADPAINIAKSSADRPLQAVVPPAYQSAIGQAGEKYLASFPHANALPAQFRWEALWAAMNVAALAPSLSQKQFSDLQTELECLEMSIARGEETKNTDRRIQEIDALMEASPWDLHPDFGILPKELASTEEVFQALTSLGLDASMDQALETKGRLDREVLAALYVNSDGTGDWRNHLASYIGENELHKEKKCSLPGVWDEVEGRPGIVKNSPFPL